MACVWDTTTHGLWIRSEGPKQDYCTDTTNSSCLVTRDGCEELDNSSKGRWTRDISQNTSKFSKKIPYVVVPQGGKKFVPLQNHMRRVTFGKSLLFRALRDL